LFAEAAAAEGVSRFGTTTAITERESGTMNESMPPPAGYAQPGSTTAAAAIDGDKLLQSSRFLEQLVDKVVDRIERHVVDELERRGRRHGRGAF
jgi:hypothetical protein